MAKKSLNIADLFSLFKKLKKSDDRLSCLENSRQSRVKEKTAYVLSAIPLTEKEKESLKNHLSSSTKSYLMIENKIDKSVLGGLRIELGSKIIDTTLKAQLEEIKKSLKNDEKN
ncbi:hypothetical protein COT75_03245 [Candidatus Beckwithbacteria bacterium CG10_big_fil_rev_8_21_14_0_10_34_10]|uniref:Uncharacterized protein n=1 Tax=Candidatus Beckwithbacteria bacterium CG10_big_fil_rev_8_21_14_0_10_34_10 TaxID=1974495 RepID=A0A2H0WB08_9BACT|nr:MAG: hypothetical protein COT75_03245 [Candidatus Beckwithbacteria bacterium CG10_big_fil_rev_8_21_14_0_10_34_10]